MKVLFIGGTGTISLAISKALIKKGTELYIVNRGNRNEALGDEGVTYITCDIQDEEKLSSLIENLSFDVVADFIAFEPSHLERDYRLFKNKTKQFIFISSASVYQKPLSDYRVNEGTPLSNPYWAYSRDKIACEAYLMDLYRNEGFPVTIVRPSHTYGTRSIPISVKGHQGGWQVAKRMLEGKPVIINGDGTALWTMTHTSDFAKGFVGLMGNIHAIGEAVQITSDETLTWNQIYQTIADALGVKLKGIHVASEFLAACSDYDFGGSLLGDKSQTVVFDNSKLKRLVPEFVATTRFDQGIKMTIDHFLANEAMQKEDPEFDAWCDRVIEALEKARKSIIL
ncbi:NAD-dependent dehydratase [Petrocella atlantisensis]|uniref:NAD-dependent dehydratase n=1 Tax=Petrocella atlantisensis TaxID=2173034 RepID=A0A3P7NX05_9FIRM|nr:SDR family oxidoreductase [Petrocella atlantisensis]VDN47515.1 NAD-dependent dehydratase [Petrocella atlantisensis]